jgi:cation diffusion facilitator family transporter
MIEARPRSSLILVSQADIFPVMQTLPLLVNAGQHAHPRAMHEQRFAIGLSLAVGFLMLAGKSYAYYITGSAAILSDAAESVVHVFAVGFAAFSLWLSQQPPDRSHPYGHEKIGFFSAGMEGGLIVIAAAYIIYISIEKWIAGLVLQNLSLGTLYVAGAALVNGALGSYLIWKGKQTGSLILTANGTHVFTDVWTSLGVVVGLILTQVTGWLPFDPIVAILAALNILWSGGNLIRRSVGGLMDEGDPEVESLIQKSLDEETAKRGVKYHELRYRNSGSSLWVEVHLLFQPGVPLERAHATASEVEAAVSRRLPASLKIITHLEPLEKHDESHTPTPPAG